MAPMENTQTHYYQAMFLLDNQEVREHGFNAVRDQVRTVLEKHGLTVHVLRLWGERPLAYRVGSRKRATYLLGWLEGSGGSANAAKADFYLVGPVFRLLFGQVDSIPEEEKALGIEEIADSDVVIPEELPDLVEEEPYVEPESEQKLTDAPEEDAESESKEESTEESKEKSKEQAPETEAEAETAATPEEASS